MKEIPYCICTTLCGTFFEVVALHLYANGTITNYFTDVFESRRTFLIFCTWVFLMPFWRTTHFYIIHRAIHPWNTTWLPDIGHYLMKYAHYLHHQSMNFTAFSGIAMHPIEGFIYMTGVLITVPFYHHPILVLLVKIDLIYKAVLSHDGYGFPGAGAWDHYIHHVKFNCNYGSNSPFDWLFGSFDDGADEWKKLMKE